MRKVKLGECLKVKHGWAFKGEYFRESGVQSILTPGNFYEKGGFKPNGGKERYYIGDYPQEYLCHKGDLIIAMTQQAEGLLGSTAIVPESGKYLHNQRIGLITCDESKLFPLFAYYLFMTKSVRTQLERSASGTKVKHTSPEKIYEVLVSLPDVEQQKNIATIVYAMEEKENINKRINDNLMQMASTAFMHYFFKQIPNGKLGDIIIEHPKSNIQVGEAQNSSGNIPFFTSGDSILKWNTVLVDDRCCYLNTGGNADVKFYVGKAAYSTDTWCVSGIDQFSDYLYLLLYTIKPELDKKFFQGTGLKHLQKPLLKDRPIYIPTTQELNVFNAQIMPMMTKISENTRENQRLVSIRDWLLPLLMNGQAAVEA